MFGPVITQRAPALVQLEIVRHERRIEIPLDDGMPAAADLDPRFLDEPRLHPPERKRALGEVREHVERRERRCTRLQRGQRRDQFVEKRLVEGALARQGAVAGAEHPILETLEFGGDVAFRVADRLPTGPVRWHLVRLAAMHLDVVALHAVVAESQIREPAALTLALLESKQRLVAVLADLSQLVELRVVSGSDDAAFAQQRRRCFDQRAREQRMRRRVRPRLLREARDERRIHLRELCAEIG